MTQESLLNKAIDLKNQGNVMEAETIFNQLINQNTETDRAYYHLALMAVDDKNLAKAIDLYNKALDVNPDYFKAYNNLGLLYLEQKQFQQAINCFQNAIDISPAETTPKLNLGLAFYQKHSFADALNAYKEIDLTQLSAKIQEEVMINMGNCYLQLRNFKEATKLYEDVVNQLNTQSLIALNQLGFIALEINHDYQIANQWIDKALIVNPEFKPALQNKGLILKALGQHAEAIQYMQKVIGIEPENFEGYYNIACIYSDMNQQEDVKINLQKALQLAPFIKDHLKQDTDFAKYKQEDWFTMLVK